MVAAILAHDRIVQGKLAHVMGYIIIVWQTYKTTNI